jgi:hypothetical protein
VLMPGQSIVTTLVFGERHGRGRDRDDDDDRRLNYSLTLLSGQGKP